MLLGLLHSWDYNNTPETAQFITDRRGGTGSWRPMLVFAWLLMKTLMHGNNIYRERASVLCLLKSLSSDEATNDVMGPGLMT